MDSELLYSRSFTRDSCDPGDWFSRVDYSLRDSSYSVGMPRSNSDGSNYDITARVRDVVATPGEAELKQTTAFYQELTTLRKSSPLLILGDGTTVMKRVDFRNTGVGQQAGLLVMTIDGGVQTGVSLDSRVDDIVVVINVVPESRTLQDFAGTPLQLNVIQ